MNRAFPRLATLVAVLLAPALVRADQVVITDVTYTHSADTTSDSHYRVPPQSGTPSNWTSPVDYSQGSVHVLLEVNTKPAGDTPTKFQICLEGTPAYACTAQSPTYTKTGKYEWDTKFADFWYGGDVDWSKGVMKVALILKDTSNGKPQGDPKYVPSDLHVQVTLVSAGSSFAPPPPAAGSGGAPAGGGSGGVGGSAGSSEVGGGGRRGGRNGGSGNGGSGSGSGGAGGAAGTVAGSGGRTGADAGSGPGSSAGTSSSAPRAGSAAGAAGRTTASAGTGTGQAGVAVSGAGGGTETSVSPGTSAGALAGEPLKKDDSGCSTTGSTGATRGALIFLAILALLRRRRTTR